jgi:hypothetical protein
MNHSTYKYVVPDDIIVNSLERKVGHGVLSIKPVVREVKCNRKIIVECVEQFL